jgi:outer membrane protein OmpA-like peptidoglycan-associated protein
MLPFGLLTGQNQEWFYSVRREEAFNKNIHEIMFPWNDHDDPSNPNILDDNVQWLKDHPSVRFYIEGYASSRGDLGYNLDLSKRRAD